jgi:copper chaperone CopZ
MKKLFLINVLLLSLLFINGCGKKNNTESSMKTTTTQDESVKIESVEFKCENMHCASCETAITDAVKKIDGIKEVYADAKSKTVKVIFNKELTNTKDIEKSINAAGYDTETSKSGNKHNCDME